MVWTYHSVEELRNKFDQGEEITAAEKRKLEKYIKQKKKVVKNTSYKWDDKQLLRAEYLLHKIQKQEKIEVEA